MITATRVNYTSRDIAEALTAPRGSKEGDDALRRVLTGQSECYHTTKDIIDTLKSAVEFSDIEKEIVCLAHLLKNIELTQIIWNNENPKAERLNPNLFIEQILDNTGFREVYASLLTSEEGRDYKKLKHPKIIKPTLLLRRIPNEYKKTHDYIASLTLSSVYNDTMQDLYKNALKLLDEETLSKLNNASEKEIMDVLMSNLKKRAPNALLMSALDAGALIQADKMLIKSDSAKKIYEGDKSNLVYRMPEVNVQYYRMKSSQNKV